MNNSHHSLKKLIKETVKRSLRENMQKAELLAQLKKAFEENPEAAKKVARMPDAAIEDKMEPNISEGLKDTIGNVKNYLQNPMRRGDLGGLGVATLGAGMGAGGLADMYNWSSFINNLTGTGAGGIASPERIAMMAATLTAAGITAAIVKAAAQEAAQKAAQKTKY